MIKKKSDPTPASTPRTLMIDEVPVDGINISIVYYHHIHHIFHLYHMQYYTSFLMHQLG